ncbi:kunitz-type protease inhibitor 2-like [Musca vetustissima]|uniref:kunitz-type protease inhibitor 2-like n=1 Tax=Musca vetustissima TaxID=27455 RepID=UPI002AB6AE32|nr:kunitz-type protease inhibitor 2-like [Musca vetustissima]
MKILSRVSLLQLLLVFIVKFSENNFVEGAVGLYGPDRYEGLPESCLLPMDFGYCRAKLQRYYFDIRRMKCTMFYWGGCAGNDNNFKTMEECNDFCSSGYEQSNNIVPLKRERSENNPNYNVNQNTRSSNFNSRGNIAGSTSKSVAPKFTIKSSPAPSYRDNVSVNNGTARANVKTFNINPPQKELKYPTATDDLEDEEYDE